MWDNFVAACSCGEARVTRLVFYNAQVNVGRFCYIFFLRRAACGCSLENNALQNKNVKGHQAAKCFQVTRCTPVCWGWGVVMGN
jgi:hypothetical protein